MSSRANYFKLGLFVICGTALLLVGLVFFGIGAFLEPRLQLETYFDGTVQGLSIGSQVKYRGVEIGSVEDIGYCRQHYDASSEEMNPEPFRYVYVAFSVDPSQIPQAEGGKNVEFELSQLVNSGLRVQLAMLGLTGSVYLEIDFWDEGKASSPLEFPWRPKDLYIPSTPSQLVELADGLNTIVKKLEGVDFAQLAANADALLQTLDSQILAADMGALQTDLRGAVRQFRNLMTTLSERMDDPDLVALPESLKSAIDGLRPEASEALTAMRSAGEQISEVGEGLKAVFSNELAASAPAAIRELRIAISQLNELMGGRDVQVDAILRNIERVSANLRDLSSLVRRNPSQIILGQPPEPRESNP